MRGFITAIRDGVTDEAIMKRLLDELADNLADNDGYGLVRWLFVRDGRNEPLMREIRDAAPAAWRAIVDRIAD